MVRQKADFRRLCRFYLPSIAEQKLGANEHAFCQHEAVLSFCNLVFQLPGRCIVLVDARKMTHNIVLVGAPCLLKLGLATTLILAR